MTNTSNNMTDIAEISPPVATVDSLLVKTSGPAADFNPNAEDPCYCGSGKSFIQCCGSTEAIRPPPFGLFMFENFLDKAVCEDLVTYAEQREGHPLMVIDNEASTPDNVVRVRDQRRITERVDLGERRSEINEFIKTTFIDLAQRCVGAQLDWFEAPDLMRYREGGFYIRHADSENIDAETKTWKKVIDRDLSMLIYLNDDFEGGALSFYKLNYQIRPRAGAAVMFPSDQRFLHQAEEVTKGVRYAIVSWAAVRGIPKISSKPPKPAILID